MKKILDVANWSRKDHFHFFKQFEEPFFGICFQIDCTSAYKYCKESGMSFFLYYLYQALASANHILPFRYRIEGDEVIEYSVIHASPTINRPDGTFGFAYIDYKEEMREFIFHAEKEIERVQQSKGLLPAMSGENVIHFSAIPWIKFTSLSHARAFSYKDSIPKISFGKMSEVAGTLSMPVSVHAHHGLMDGYHVGQFVELFQERLNL